MDRRVKHEDLSFKQCSIEFKEGLRELLDLDCDIEENLPTEVIKIENSEKQMDCLYNTNKGYLINLEFQSTDTKFEEDLKRFFYYGVSTMYKYDKDVATYIIYGKRVKRKDVTLKQRFGTFTPKAIFLNEIYIEDELEKIKSKIRNGEILTEYDDLMLAMSPALNYRSSLKPLVKEVITITEKLPRKYILSNIIFLLCNKFLNDNEIEEIKEELSMCDLMREIAEESERKGEQKGEQKGIMKTYINIVSKKLNKGLKLEEAIDSAEVEEEYINKVREYFNKPKNSSIGTVTGFSTK